VSLAKRLWIGLHTTWVLVKQESKISGRFMSGTDGEEHFVSGNGEQDVTYCSAPVQQKPKRALPCGSTRTHKSMKL
jgi:hypothetical protein